MPRKLLSPRLPTSQRSAPLSCPSLLRSTKTAHRPASADTHARRDIRQLPPSLRRESAPKPVSGPPLHRATTRAMESDRSSLLPRRRSADPSHRPQSAPDRLVSPTSHPTSAPPSIPCRRCKKEAFPSAQTATPSQAERKHRLCVWSG